MVFPSITYKYHLKHERVAKKNPEECEEGGYKCDTNTIWFPYPAL